MNINIKTHTSEALFGRPGQSAVLSSRVGDRQLISVFLGLCVLDGAFQPVTCVSTGSVITGAAAPFGRQQQPCVIITPPHVQREAKHGRHIQREADSKHDSTMSTRELLSVTHEKKAECKNPRPLTKSSHQSGGNAAFLFTAAFSLSFAALIH